MPDAECALRDEPFDHSLGQIRGADRGGNRRVYHGGYDFCADGCAGKLAESAGDRAGRAAVGDGAIGGCTLADGGATAARGSSRWLVRLVDCARAHHWAAVLDGG